MAAANVFEVMDDLFDKPVWGGGSGGDADGFDASEVVGVDLVGRFYEKAFFTLLLADGEQLDAI